jgi:hypothetical protein
MKTSFLFWILSFVLVITLVPLSGKAAEAGSETATFVVG